MLTLRDTPTEALQEQAACLDSVCLVVHLDRRTGAVADDERPTRCGSVLILTAGKDVEEQFLWRL